MRIKQIEGRFQAFQDVDGAMAVGEGETLAEAMEACLQHAFQLLSDDNEEQHDQPF